MNEFDLRLEFELRRLLNPIVAAPAPIRCKGLDRQRTDDAQSPGQPTPGAIFIGLPLLRSLGAAVGPLAGN
jgi:hypothetical protein